MDILQELREPSVWVPAVICVVAFMAHRHYVNGYAYWEKRNVKGVKPIVPILPEIWNLLMRNRLNSMLERTRKFGKVYGSFHLGKPQLVVADPEVIRQITIKDFDSFQDHQVSEWSNKYQRKFLVWLKGEHWRRVRALMTPSFTSGKIKRMFRLLDGCAEDLVDNLGEQFEQARANGSDRATVDLFDLYGMYTMDGITTCCYGIKLKREANLEKASSRNAFVRDASCLFQFNLTRFFIVALTPKSILRRFQISMLPEKKLRPLVDRVEQLVEKRRQGSTNKYDDLLQLLIDARLDDDLELNEMDLKENHHASLTHESLISDQKMLKSSLNGTDRLAAGDSSASANSGSTHQVKMSHFEILAEAMFLLAAGLDTTRSSLSTITYFLAHNIHVQERLYRELKAIATVIDNPTNVKKKSSFIFEYDALTSCDYLDAVISESLRIFGPAPIVDRLALNDYHIEKYNIFVPKGSRLLLGLHSVQNDPDYWDKPEQFNPDRFMPGQRDNIVPGSYAPFSMGPRHCVGMRFSLTETKLGLAKLLMSFKFEPAPGTKYPPEPNVGIGLVSVRNCRALVLPRK